jgi:hypothetical protein
MFLTSRSRFALAVAGATVLVVAGSGAAFASSNGTDITWQNAATGYYLQGGDSTIDQGNTRSVFTAPDPGVQNCGPSNYEIACDPTWWDDTRQSNGTWTELSTWDNGCLDSNNQWTTYGNAYTHTCISGDVYQEWFEVYTATGWYLEDAETGLYLDGGNGPNANGQFAANQIFTNSNYGNSDSYQRWH